MKASLLTYADLEREKLRLQVALAHQESLVRKDIEDIKVELKPITSLAVLMANGMKAAKSPLLTVGITLLGDLMMKYVLFGRGSLVARLVVPGLVKLTSRIFSTSGKNILPVLAQRVLQFGERFRK